MSAHVRKQASALHWHPRRLLASLARGILLVPLVLLVLLPIAVAVFHGFRSHAEILRDPFSWPSRWRAENYTSVLTSPGFWQMLGNSAFVGFATTLGTVFLSSMAAYACARIRFAGREALYLFLILGLFFPMGVALLPLYLIARDLRLLNSLWGVILPQIAFGLPVNMVILRRFFVQIPLDLEEAATLDGASYLQQFWYIFLPLMRPALAAVSALNFIGSWNAFFWPLLVLNSESKYTLPLGVMQFSTQYGGLDLGRVMAYVTLSMIPAIIFYVFAERHIVAGLTAGIR